MPLDRSRSEAKQIATHLGWKPLTFKGQLPIEEILERTKQLEHKLFGCSNSSKRIKDLAASVDVANRVPGPRG